jgi:hypothetical protein
VAWHQGLRLLERAGRLLQPEIAAPLARVLRQVPAQVLGRLLRAELWEVNGARTATAHDPRRPPGADVTHPGRDAKEAHHVIEAVSGQTMIGIRRVARVPSTSSTAPGPRRRASKTRASGSPICRRNQPRGFRYSGPGMAVDALIRRLRKVATANTLREVGCRYKDHRDPMWPPSSTGSLKTIGKGSNLPRADSLRSDDPRLATASLRVADRGGARRAIPASFEGRPAAIVPQGLPELVASRAPVGEQAQR